MYDKQELPGDDLDPILKPTGSPAGIVAGAHRLNGLKIAGFGVLGSGHLLIADLTLVATSGQGKGATTTGSGS